MNDLYDQLNMYNAGQRRTPHNFIYFCAPFRSTMIVTILLNCIVPMTILYSIYI